MDRIRTHLQWVNDFIRICQKTTLTHSKIIPLIAKFKKNSTYFKLSIILTKFNYLSGIVSNLCLLWCTSRWTGSLSWTLSFISLLPVRPIKISCKLQKQRKNSFHKPMCWADMTGDHKITQPSANNPNQCFNYLVSLFW